MAERKLRLLCLDGGGVRGLSSLYILKQIMEMVAPENPPKPCNFFDMIGGTSTGGLIAVMLGRLEMDVSQCIDVYINLMDTVFKKRQHRISVRGKVQARFDTEQLEKEIKKVIVQCGQPENEPMRYREANPEKCKVFVCAVSKGHRELDVQFTNYKRTREADSELFDNVKIWEACRATSAATTFFSPIQIGRNNQEFLDGATSSNNPIRKLWKEAHGVWGGQGPMDSQIQCIVSIGTGMPSVEPFGEDPLAIGRTLLAIATETESTANDFAQEHEDLDDRDGLFRFNVLQGLQNVGLEEAGARNKIADSTMAYGQREMQKSLRQFKRVVGDVGESVGPETPAATSSRPTEFPFLTLDDSPKFLKAKSGYYWEHLTMESLKVYERIYDLCKDLVTGLVSYDEFRKQLSGKRPPEWLVPVVWSRIDRNRNLLLPRNLVLAIVYMLHVESFIPNHTPKNMEVSSVTFGLERRKILECYGNWVVCACNCGRKWSFANGLDGLRKDTGKRKGCDAGKWKDAGRLRRFLQRDKRKGPELYDQNRRAWLKERQTPVRPEGAMLDGYASSDTY